MMKRIYITILLGLLACASGWCDETILYWDGTTGANSMTLTNGFTIAITGNTSKSWASGNGQIEYNGGKYQTLKNSNAAQITLTCPQGKAATGIDFYVVTNDASTKAYLSEFDGQSCNVEVSSLKDYANRTKISKSVSNKKTFTFTFSGKQVCFIAVVTYQNAQSQASTYSITYDTNGATGNIPQNLTDQTALPSTLPTPQKTGYRFDGWYTDAQFNTAAVAGATLTGNVTLYAKWTQLFTLNVTVNEVGWGTVSSSSIADIPANSSTWNNNNQFGVNSTTITATAAQEGAGYRYAFSSWSNLPNQITANATVTAVFSRSAIHYTITYNNVDGVSTSLPTDYTVESETFTIPTPEKTGYRFDGWTGDNTTIAKGSTGNKTYTANWTQVYSITYECNGATSGCPSNLTEQTALPSMLPTPTKDGYSFVGWYTDAQLNTAAVAGASISANTTLYAKWEADLYTPWNLLCSFFNGSAKAFEKKIETLTSQIGYFEVELPGNTDYTFSVRDNNNTEYGCSAEKKTDSFSDVVFYNGQSQLSFHTTVAGKYEFKIDYSGSNPKVSLTYPLSYSLTYNAGGATGNVPATTHWIGGESVTLPAAGDLAMEGCTFDGWSDGETTYQAGATYVMPAHSVTLTAVWRGVSVLYESSYVVAADGKSVDLTLKTEGTATATVRWYRNGKAFGEAGTTLTARYPGTYVGKAYNSNGVEIGYSKDIELGCQESYVLTTSDNDYYTLYLGFEAAIPEGIKVFTGELDAEETKLTLTQVEGTLPARTAVLVKSPESTGQFEFVETFTSAAAIANNSLYGVESTTPYTTIASTTGKMVLTLGVKDGVVAFRKPYSASGSLKANRACLPITEKSNPAPIRVVMAGDEATDVEQIATEAAAQKVIEDGHVYIIKEGVKYTVLGQIVK